MYAYFLARLETAISHTVIGEEAKRQLEKLLAYENANQECQKAIAPIRETGTITDYLKGCRNLRLETQKMQMLAETMVAALRKGNEGCFTCRNKKNFKRDWRGQWHPRQYSCLENPMDGGAWWAAVHGVTKSRTRRLSDLTFTFHFHALEKEMATHSSVLAWRIPGTGEPGGLPSMGSHRIRHD